ncbi:hypothetical protein FACS1894164_17600 [Spirochaetia bacterium]|nr:hypothetical protein FACS1894164_17600 [Spirochaetia bacterium]
MGIIDQVKVLESRIVEVLENATQIKEENQQLKENLESAQKRINLLENEQNAVQNGILEMLGRLNTTEQDPANGAS